MASRASFTESQMMSADTSAPLVPAKRRVVTSCSECHRRKQKCDRALPCNFCSSRGVPERCRYGKLPPELHQIEASNTRSQPKRNKRPEEPPLPCSELDILDQVGYSRASRHHQFESLKEAGLDGPTCIASNEQATALCDSAAYRALIALLPSESVVDDLIQIYFAEENWSLPILDKQRVFQLYKAFQNSCGGFIPPKCGQHLPLVPSIVPALLFSILAVALQFISTEINAAHNLRISTFSDCDRISKGYIENGQEIVNLLRLQKPTTTLIEYHLMRTMWLKNCGRGGEAWQVLGVALRYAQELDLHQIRENKVEAYGQNVEQSLLQFWELEHQKRLWARLFILDSHMAMALGRPRGIHREDCSTPDPLDCDYPNDPLRTVPISTKHSYEPPNEFSSAVFWIGLSHLIHDMMAMHASTRHPRDDTKIQALHQAVISLMNGLPSTLRPSFPDTSWDQQLPQLPAVRLRLLTTANIFLLALYRPYVSTDVASRHAATEVAFEILQTQHRLFETTHEPHRKLYGYSFYTIDAGLFVAAVVIKFSAFDMNTSARALQQICQAISWLSLMADRNSMARKGVPILERCCRIIEANTLSPFNTSSNDTFGDEDLQKEIASFLQHMSTNLPDEPAQQLLSSLAHPSTPTSLTFDPVFPLGDFLGQTSDMPAIMNQDGNIW